MEIKHVEKGGRGGFMVRGEGGKRVAELTYSVAGDSGIVIDHTEVDEEMRGQNVGESLLAEAVKFAREKGLKIYATCPFALAKLKESAEYADLFAG